MRLVAIDGLRGFFLVFMIVVHANEILKTIIGKLNHHSFGWVEDAQGFVFLSGLVVGLVYGGRYLRQGYQSMRKSIWLRIRTIYSHQIFLILLFSVVALIYTTQELDVPLILLPYSRDPALFPALSALLVAGSMHMGILRMYIFFMMVTPFALELLERQRYATYAVLMFSFWALAQTRILDHIIGLTEQTLMDNGHAIQLGASFNIFGWQVLFFGGLAIGFLMAANKLRTEIIFRDEMRSIFFISLALFFIYGIYDRIVFGDWFGSPFSEMIKTETDRENFSVIYAVTFLVDLFLVAWLLGPGLTDRSGLVRRVARIVHRIFTFPPLVFLGQHSLHVFTAHILIVYALAVFYQWGPPDEATGTFLIFLCVTGIYGAAWLHSKWNKWSKVQIKA